MCVCRELLVVDVMRCDGLEQAKSQRGRSAGSGMAGGLEGWRFRLQAEGCKERIMGPEHVVCDGLVARIGDRLKGEQLECR